MSNRVNLGVGIGAILIGGVVLISSLTGCHKNNDGPVITTGKKTYKASSLYVLYSDKSREIHICSSEEYSYKEINTYGYRLKPHLKDDGEYGFGYVDGPINEIKTLYQYTDIDSLEVIVREPERGEYNKVKLDSYLSNTAVSYSYSDAVDVVKEELFPVVKGYNS